MALTQTLDSQSTTVLIVLLEQLYPIIGEAVRREYSSKYIHWDRTTRRYIDTISDHKFREELINLIQKHR